MSMGYKAIRTYIETHERQVSIGALVLGFVWDSITLGRPDQFFGNFILITYLVVSAALIFFLGIYEKKGKDAPAFLLPLVQFSFGNLAGGLLVVYGQSGTLEGSALFFILLFAFLLGNEFARSYYARFNFHIVAWYFLLFAYLSVVVPILIGKLGTFIFILSGLASLLITAGFLFLVRKVSPRSVIANIQKTALSIGFVFVLFNILYFANVIPPVPLSLTDIGIYHSLEREKSGNYLAFYENPPWYRVFRDTSKSYHRGNSSRAYCFTSIFAPVRLSTGVVHRWEEYSQARGEWQTRSVVSFPLSGGRQEGYRGYSIETGLTDGKWRCSVETENGALIGRTTFDVVPGTPDLRTKTF